MKILGTLLLTLLLCRGALGKELKLFDAMNFQGKPSSEELGCVRFARLSQWQLHGGGQQAELDDESKPSGRWYRHWAREMEDRGEVVAWLNLERWGCNQDRGLFLAEKYKRNKLATLALLRDEAPGVQWQVYNWTVDDQSIYWSLSIDRVRVDQWWRWQRFNERFALPVLQAQHSIFPDCYLRAKYNDEQWKRTEGSVIREVQRLVPGKPIYAFLRFRYEKMEWVPPERMRMALNYLEDLGVNGFVLWSPSWSTAIVSWETPELKALWSVISEVRNDKRDD